MRPHHLTNPLICHPNRKIQPFLHNSIPNRHQRCRVRFATNPDNWQELLWNNKDLLLLIKSFHFIVPGDNNILRSSSRRRYSAHFCLTSPPKLTHSDTSVNSVVCVRAFCSVLTAQVVDTRGERDTFNILYYLPLYASSISNQLINNNWNLRDGPEKDLSSVLSAFRSWKICTICHIINKCFPWRHQIGN